MKPIAIILCLILAGCAAGLSNKSIPWERIANLTGEPLVDSLIESGDVQLAERKEIRRNMRLEITRIEVDAKEGRDKLDKLETAKANEANFTQELYNQALEHKMAIWRAIHEK